MGEKGAGVRGEVEKVVQVREQSGRYTGVNFYTPLFE